jgi:hypothetical protein
MENHEKKDHREADGVLEQCCGVH